MTLQELAEEFRNQVNDTEQPYLWSDNEVLRYIIDAQDQFVRLTGGIADMQTADICTLTLEASNPWTAHSPYILRILSGRLITAERDIEFVQESDLVMLREKDYGAELRYRLDDTEEGEVRFGVLGLHEKQIRWLLVPEEADTCNIRVLRLPYPRLPSAWDSVEAADELEIDEWHHINLIPWMKHLAYNKADAETRNDKLAAENKLAFMQYCTQARNELDRRRYRPRVVQYNGL